MHRSTRSSFVGSKTVSQEREENHYEINQLDYSKMLLHQTQDSLSTIKSGPMGPNPEYFKETHDSLGGYFRTQSLNQALVSFQKHQLSSREDAIKSNVSTSNNNYADEEIRRIHEEAERKERALVEKFSQLKQLAKEALFSNTDSNQTFERRMNRFEEIIGALGYKQPKPDADNY